MIACWGTRSLGVCWGFISWAGGVGEAGNQECDAERTPRGQSASAVLSGFVPPTAPELPPWHGKSLVAVSMATFHSPFTFFQTVTYLPVSSTWPPALFCTK